MITSFAAGSTVTVVSLPAWGFAGLDTNGLVDSTQMPIDATDAKRTLAIHSTLGVTWLNSLEDWVRINHGLSTDPINIAWTGGRWPLNDPIWAAIKAQLNVITGSFTDTDLANLIAEIRSNR